MTSKRTSFSRRGLRHRGVLERGIWTPFDEGCLKALYKGLCICYFHPVKRGLGTQLRHLIELLDGAVSDAYANEGLSYRPRYTPIMRAVMTHDPVGVTQIAQTAGITQPAATQTIALMIRDGLLFAEPSTVDNRHKLIRMTPHGQDLLPHLEACWDATTAAANSLDDDLPFPLSELLDLAIKALARDPFGARIEAARKSKATKRTRNKTSRTKASTGLERVTE